MRRNPRQIAMPYIDKNANAHGYIYYYTTGQKLKRMSYKSLFYYEFIILTIFIDYKTDRSESNYSIPNKTQTTG